MARPESSAPGASKRAKKESERVPTARSKNIASKPTKLRAVKEACNSRTVVSPPTTSSPVGKRKRSQPDEPTTDGTTSSHKRPRTAPSQKDQAKGRPTKPRESELPVVNKVPEEILSVYIFGGGEMGELGLGPNYKEANRPVLNPSLDPSSPTAYHIVDLACGAMHTVALSADNQIVTWGVNDEKALGRSTDWDGGLRDFDADPDEDGELNPLESTPTEILTKYFPPSTDFPRLLLGIADFEGNNRFGYDEDGKIITEQETPIQILGIPKITQIVCGSRHALALDTKGKIWAWGNNERNQFGCPQLGLRQQDSFVPSQVRVCRGNVKYIASGGHHCFAIDWRDNIWAWGSNSYGKAGDPVTVGGDSPFLRSPVKIRHLYQKEVTMLAGGAYHSAAVTAGGQCFVWGRVDAGQLGVAFTAEQIQDENHIRCDDRGRPRICLRPTAVPNIEQASHVACGLDHTVFIDRSGAAYSSGFGSQGQLGLGSSTDDVEVATLIVAKAVKNKVLIRAEAAGNYSIIAAKNGSKARLLLCLHGLTRNNSPQEISNLPSA
ncbi:regulator of chromosome condensation 1/beta-lactamase-inhibitor protein II [Xylariaceae sp. FL1651]|nr:regulator of chromosome condensation 1/beta-lactamase-inhibitor protein II [Xylariaceae sp. FL1651]